MRRIRNRTVAWRQWPAIDLKRSVRRRGEQRRSSTEGRESAREVGVKGVYVVRGVKGRLREHR